MPGPLLAAGGTWIRSHPWPKIPNLEAVPRCPRWHLRRSEWWRSVWAWFWKALGKLFYMNFRDFYSAWILRLTSIKLYRPRTILEFLAWHGWNWKPFFVSVGVSKTFNFISQEGRVCPKGAVIQLNATSPRLWSKPLRGVWVAWLSWHSCSWRECCHRSLGQSIYIYTYIHCIHSACRRQC